MSKYTTEVRYICEHYAGLDESKGYDSISSIIEKSRSKIFDFKYPIFDETYRSVIETKILRHFYLREICAETIGVWKHFLEMRMNEIMPYYNKLYKSELIEFNPLYDVDLTREYNKDGKNTGTINDVLSESEVLDRNVEDSESGETHVDGTDGDVRKNTRWDIYSDTPQGGLTNVENETYLTNARKIVDDGTGTLRTIDNDTEYSQTGTTNEDSEKTRNRTDTNTRNLRDIEDYIEHVKGKTGSSSFSKLLQEFRGTFLNIDVMIINDLNDLFFGLW